jgi:hypothetical protein
MDVNAEIVRMKRQGYSIDQCYIYVKDYVSLEQFAHLYEAL